MDNERKCPMVEKKSLVSLFDFENREKVFPGIDSRIKFCLLTLTGADHPSKQAPLQTAPASGSKVFLN